MWAQRIAKAQRLHKEDKDTKEAQKRSGGNTGKHGLTHEEWLLRETRKRSRNEYHRAQQLYRELEKGKGNGKAKGNGKKGKGNSKANGKWNAPRAYEELTPYQQRLLQELKSGRLWKRKRESEKHCSRVQAKDFNVFDYD